MRLCNQFSDPVVRVYSVLPNAAASESYDVRLNAIYYAKSAPPFASYPADAPVLDHDRVVRAGVQPDNYFAACLEEPAETSPAIQSTLTTFASAGTNMPFCPKTFLANGRVLMRTAAPVSEEDTFNAQRWALRGAIAAGMSVFTYLQANDLVRTKARPYYNECQLLP